MRRIYFYFILLSYPLCIFHISAQNLSYNFLPSTSAKTQFSSPLFESELAYEVGIAKLNRETPIEIEYNDDVKAYIDLFLGKRRSDVDLFLERSAYYFPIIEEALDRYNLPLELKYIAVIESGLNPLACSKSGAIGLWQFLYNTCSLFDLKVDSYIDERRDVYKSTDAACRYLQYLYLTFRDWNLVMAGYNGGPGEVRKAIERSGGKTNYWEIRPYLSNQAKNYVPAFIAIGYLMNNYAMYDFNYKPDDHLLKTDTLHISYAVSFDQISSVIDISVKELEKLNPAYKRHHIPQLNTPCLLVLPEDRITEYLQAEKKVLEVKLPVESYKTLLANAGDMSDRTKILHVVQPGEYYHKIALRYNCTIENIKAWNGLSSMVIHPGQILEIWINE
jgi:membrane-bound lytic murein transglycosylase D